MDSLLIALSIACSVALSVGNAMDITKQKERIEILETIISKEALNDESEDTNI